MFSVDDLDINFDEVFEHINEPSTGTGLAIENDEQPSQLNSQKEAFRKSTLLTSTPNPTNYRKNITIKHTTPLTRNGQCSSSRKQCVIRKFPGPAGLLPDKPSWPLDNPLLIISHADDEPKAPECKPILCSQASESAFSEPPFKRLKRDFNIDARDSPLGDFTVAWLKKGAQVLKGRKVPFLAVILQSVDCSSGDPILSMRDPTGEISGTLHREVWQEFGEHFKPGAAIVLKQVGIFNTGIYRRKMLLNITKNNIVTVYSPSEEGGILVNSVHPTTTEDLIKSIAAWQTQVVQSPAIASNSFSSPKPHHDLFQTISSTTPSLHDKRQKLVNSVEVNRPFTPIVPSVKKTLQTKAAPSNFDLFLDDSDIAELEKAIASQTPPSEPHSNHPNQCVNDLLFDVDPQLEDSIISQGDDKLQYSRETSNCFRKLAKPASASFVPKSANVNQNTKAADKLHPPKLPRRQSLPRFEICSQSALTDAEASQIDEVLSGVDLEEFE